MGGFLQGLGEFAGGVSKGISQEAEDRARRAQARAAEEEATRKREQDTREGVFAQRIAQANNLKVGLGGADYAFDQNTPAAPPPEKSEWSKAAGALASLFGKKDMDTTAVAAGVRPPMLGVMPGPPGSPSAQAVAAPAAAPAATPAAVPAEPSTPDRVPVAGSQGQLMRPATDIDRQLYLAKAYAEARMPDKANEAYEKHGEMVVNRHLGMVDTATPAELSNFASGLEKQRVRFAASKDDPDSLSMWVTEKDKDGKDVETQVLKDVSRGEVKGYLGQYLNQNEDKRQALIASSRHERMEAMKARADIAQSEAVARHYGATTKQVEEATTGAVQARQRGLKDLDDHDFGITPGSAIADPIRAAALANDPKYNYKRKVTDPTTGVMSEVNGNYMKDKLDKEQADWEGSPWSGPKAQIVRRTTDAKGENPAFVVLGPDGHNVKLRDGNVATWDTPQEAENYAQSLYNNDPAAAVKTVLAAQAAAKAKTPAGNAAAALAKAEKDKAARAVQAKALADKAAAAKLKADKAAAKAAEEATLPPAVQSFRRSMRGIGSGIAEVAAPSEALDSFKHSIGLPDQRKKK